MKEKKEERRVRRSALRVSEAEPEAEPEPEELNAKLRAENAKVAAQVNKRRDWLNSPAGVEATRVGERELNEKILAENKNAAMWAKAARVRDMNDGDLMVRAKRAGITRRNRMRYRHNAAVKKALKKIRLIAVADLARDAKREATVKREEQINPDTMGTITSPGGGGRKTKKNLNKKNKTKRRR